MGVVNKIAYECNICPSCRNSAYVPMRLILGKQRFLSSLSMNLLYYNFFFASIYADIRNLHLSYGICIVQHNLDNNVLSNLLLHFCRTESWVNLNLILCYCRKPKFDYSFGGKQSGFGCKKKCGQWGTFYIMCMVRYRVLKSLESKCFIEPKEMHRCWLTTRDICQRECKIQGKK